MMMSSYAWKITIRAQSYYDFLQICKLSKNDGVVLSQIS